MDLATSVIDAIIALTPTMMTGAPRPPILLQAALTRRIVHVRLRVDSTIVRTGARITARTSARAEDVAVGALVMTAKDVGATMATTNVGALLRTVIVPIVPLPDSKVDAAVVTTGPIIGARVPRLRVLFDLPTPVQAGIMTSATNARGGDTGHMNAVPDPPTDQILLSI